MLEKFEEALSHKVTKECWSFFVLEYTNSNPAGS
jgi:hypothetical protein